ncbi:MAG: HAMP domain-containing sensor histidine kinase [Chloroflexi bacterium]|nr:HAMP domain-containing sensor histidine kinase [Chloroflexota bacterium]
MPETLRAYRHKLADEQIEERLGHIQEQVGYLKTIMEDVLQLARLQARRAEFNPVQLNLDALCRSILDELQNPLDGPPRLSYTSNDVIGEMNLDKKLMRQLITNLVSNALKYSPEAKPVQVNLQTTSSMIVFQVSDQGIGIPTADLKHLFQPFHRAANVGVIAGTGLGLAITKEAVERHGGTITVESQVGVGTTFTVNLPLVTAGEKDDDKNLGN